MALTMVRAIRWANAEESGVLILDENSDLAFLLFALLTAADTWHYTYVPLLTRETDNGMLYRM